MMRRRGWLQVVAVVVLVAVVALAQAVGGSGVNGQAISPSSVTVTGTGANVVALTGAAPQVNWTVAGWSLSNSGGFCSSSGSGFLAPAAGAFECSGGACTFGSQSGSGAQNFGTLGTGNTNVGNGTGNTQIISTCALINQQGNNPLQLCGSSTGNPVTILPTTGTNVTLAISGIGNANTNVGQTGSGVTNLGNTIGGLAMNGPVSSTNKIAFGFTDLSGTPGSGTANNASFRAAIANAASAATITNSTVAAASIVKCQLETTAAGVGALVAAPAAGSVVVTSVSATGVAQAATATAKFSCIVTN